MRVRCANRNCGLIYDDEKGHLVHVSKTVTEVHCPRCDGSEYYNLKPGEVEKPKTGAQLIALERIRQTKVLGWTAQYDDGHARGEIAAAGALYAMHAAGFKYVIATEGMRESISHPVPVWPWAPSYWKPTSPLRDLIKAGALIAAEIDRRQRLGEKVQ